jgi:hypothetical protein
LVLQSFRESGPLENAQVVNLSRWALPFCTLFGRALMDQHQEGDLLLRDFSPRMIPRRSYLHLAKAKPGEG